MTASSLLCRRRHSPRASPACEDVLHRTLTDRRQGRSIRLLPQEREGQCRFDGQFVATQNALNRFGDDVVLSALDLVKKEVLAKGGMNRFQVLDVDGKRLWIIDDAPVVTALLPDDY